MANPKRLIRAVWRVVAIGAGLAGGAYATYVAVTWFRYGRPQRRANEGGDSLLDRFMATYDIVERHQVSIDAPADLTFSAACDLDLQESRLIGALFKARERLLGSTPQALEHPRAIVPWAKAMGWGVLADVPGREIVMGAVTRPWDADATLRSVPPERFAAFNEPNAVKIVWTLRTDPVNAGRSLARTETRAVATDATARRRFRRYWALFSPGIILIRREALRLVKADAERRARADHFASTDRFELASTGDLDPQC